MNLETVLENQAEFQEYLGYSMGHGEEAIRNNVLALIVEATEVLNEVNWKQWSSKEVKVNRQALAFEIVDVLALLGNIINEAGFSATEIETAYTQKLEIYYAKAKR